MWTWRATATVVFAVALSGWWRPAAVAEAAPEEVIIPVAGNIGAQFQADGRLMEAMWKAAVQVKDFNAPAAAKAEHVPTVRLIQDRKALYVAVECRGPVGNKDEAVIALSPGIKGQACPIIEIHLGPALSCTVVPYGWGEARQSARTPAFPNAVAKTETGWSAEFAVPFASFEGKFMSRDWLANFTCKTAEGDYTWARARKYDIGEKFGPLGFPVDGAEAVTLNVPHYKNVTLKVKIDGRVQPSGEWDRATCRANVWPVNMLGRQQDTECRLMADASNLFLAVDCRNADRPEKEGFQERLMFLLCVDSTRSPVYRYEVGQFGAVISCDRLPNETGASWQEGLAIEHGVWRTSDDSRWRLELRIPLNCLRPDLTSDPWRISIVRKVLTGEMVLAGYAPTEEPTGFGFLKLGEPSAVRSPGKEMSVGLLAAAVEVPVVDGNGADGCWSQAAPVTDFEVANERMPPKPTSWRAVRDAGTLYLLVSCEQVEPMLPQLPQVTVLLAPVEDNSRWFEIVAGPDGKVTARARGSAVKGAAGTAPDVKCAVGAAEGVMTFEFAVPLDILGPKALDRGGRINVIRQTTKGTVWWSGDPSTSRQPAGFGVMTFTDANTEDKETKPTP